MKQLNQLLNRLEEVCIKYRWQEKLLLTNSRSQGYMLLEMLARRAGTWLNLRPITITELAYREAEVELRQQSLRVIDEIEQMQLVGKVLAEVHARQELDYFLELYQLGVLEPWMHRTLNELRLSGIVSTELAGLPLGVKDKGRELALILQAYEQGMETSQAVDQAGLYRRAIEQIPQNIKSWPQRLLLIPNQLELPELAQELLQAIPGDSRIYLPQVKVVGMRPPSQLKVSPEAAKGNGIEYLFTEAASVNELAVEIIPAYGSSNEVRSVLRKIHTTGIPLDTVLLAYTDTAGYARLSQTLLASLGMPATFAEGIMIDQTAPGRLLLLILEWIEQDYSAAVFQRLLMDGYLNQEFATNYGRIWLEVGVGRGLEQYLPALLHWQTVLQAKAETNNQAGEDLADLQGLIEFCDNLFTQLGSAMDTNAVDFAVLCRGLANCLQHFAWQDKATDHEALEVLSQMLVKYQDYFAAPVTLNRGLCWLRQTIGKQSVAVSGPQPGYLHVCHYREGEWCDRENTFVVGLDANVFPGSGHQDPILLDEERLKLGHLTLKAQEANNNLYRLTRFLATRRGKLTLLYSSYDPARFQPLLPCSLLLQVFRLVSGHPEADYTELLSAMPLPANYLPLAEDQSLRDGEWWSQLLRTSGGNDDWPLDFKACYPGLSQGIQAELYRASNAFTVYDGLIADDTKRLDYREQNRAISPSSLEAVGRCPFAYFLRFVLGIEPPPDLALDNGTWLDPLQMGSLLHDIYCNFGRQQLTPSEATTDVLVTTALATIAAWRIRVPVPNELVFEATKQEIITGLEVFQRLYYNNRGEYEPAYFEVPFGLGDQEVKTAGTGLIAPLKLKLPDGRFIKFRGRIDRLDRPCNGGGYRVWDYKTGGHSHYSEQSNLKQGRQWQPLIYTLAAQTILDEGLDTGAQVEMAGYLFPTQRGEGNFIARHQEATPGAIKALTSLLDLIAQGSFICRHNNEECFFCDYQVVCRYPLGYQRSAQKLAADQGALLQVWKELQAYD
ncbi:MAG: PD-(D/E)XK nuclease family protein [Methylocystaceae bacterium]